MPVTPTTSARPLTSPPLRGLMSGLVTAPTPDDPDCLHGLTAFVAQAVGRGRREGDRVAGPEDELVEADNDVQVSAEDVSELVAVVAEERVGRAGGTTGRIGRLDEIDILVSPEHQPLPRHTGIEGDGRSSLRTLRASPGPGTVGDLSAGDGGPGSKRTSSTVTPNSTTKAYNVRTEGRILPVSICEIELGERSSLRASSRRLIPRSRRISRSRGPSPDDASGTLAIV